MSSIPVITDYRTHKALMHLACEGDIALKAGILPYHRNEKGELQFLVAAPRPVRDPNDTVPLGIARGSRRILQEGEWVDARDMDTLNAAEKVEPAHLTALDEAEEELGLPRRNIIRLIDCSILQYKNYGIHFYLAPVKNPYELTDARDSSRVEWVTLPQAAHQARQGLFNTGYLALLEALAAVAQSVP